MLVFPTPLLVPATTMHGTVLGKVIAAQLLGASAC